MHDEILEIYDQSDQMSPEEFLEEIENEMKKVMEETNQTQPVIEEKISEQQIIEDKISEKIVIDNILFENSVGSQLTAKNGGLLCTTHSEVYRQEVTKKVTVRSFVEVIREVKYQINTEENQTSYAEEDKIQNAEIAQVLSEKPESLPFNYWGTTSLISLSFISSSLESGGTSLISTPVLTALFLGTSTPLPTSFLDSTPPPIHPTSTSGGTSTGATSTENSSILCSPSCMQLLPPLTGIGVHVSPPPTASSCSTGVYSFTSSASSENVADNPDNPDLGFVPSGNVHDITRKSASTFWTFIASRG